MEVAVLVVVVAIYPDNLDPVGWPVCDPFEKALAKLVDTDDRDPARQPAVGGPASNECAREQVPDGQEQQRCREPGHWPDRQQYALARQQRNAADCHRHARQQPDQARQQAATHIADRGPVIGVQPAEEERRDGGHAQGDEDLRLILCMHAQRVDQQACCQPTGKYGEDVADSHRCKQEVDRDRWPRPAGSCYGRERPENTGDLPGRSTSQHYSNLARLLSRALTWAMHTNPSANAEQSRQIAGRQRLGSPSCRATLKQRSGFEYINLVWVR